MKDDVKSSSFDEGGVVAGDTEQTMGGDDAVRAAVAPRRTPTSRVLGALGELAVTAGVLVLLFVAWQLWWTDVLANRDQREAVQALQEQWREPQSVVPLSEPPQDALEPLPEVTALPEVPAPRPGEVFAVLRIPRWGDDYARPLVEGIEPEELERGVGHYPGTALPGSVGNFSTAGHRTTYGKPYNRIDELQVGDEVFVDTKVGTFVYRVRGWEIVRPDRIDMVAPVPGRPGQPPTERLMTFIACHPEFSAKYRWITTAVFDRVEPVADL